eukprot:CAMPEP_0202902028 /NCGR_PEP_ID=MMETSP1392-20130828/15934_1 /ASSEMBLY_ACC=CAM_ASM_000868 /TAXON_ID=225041 /ORGANISM="Chlamydomonas chlamydogama, Strain SAG 11-48b" /LENGTH=219 /DNA_ID=CAMNT_0049588707 /DNA_START=93 /DNA_END=754 /DNA_ORIENTATION=-
MAGTKVYVGNLRPDCSERELDNEFGRFGRIYKIWVARKPPGFAFIDFEDYRDAEDAVRKLDGHQGWRVEILGLGVQVPGVVHPGAVVEGVETLHVTSAARLVTWPGTAGPQRLLVEVEVVAVIATVITALAEAAALAEAPAHVVAAAAAPLLGVAVLHQSAADLLLSAAAHPSGAAAAVAGIDSYEPVGHQGHVTLMSVACTDTWSSAWPQASQPYPAP